MGIKKTNNKMISNKDFSIFVLQMEDKKNFALSSFWRTKMIFFYITLAADYLKMIFYDLQFETDKFITAIVYFLKFY